MQRGPVNIALRAADDIETEEQVPDKNFGDIFEAPKRANFARRHAHNPRFSFGTGKFGDLAAFASAIVLGLIALQIAFESVTRLFNPVAIAYGEAITIAVVGLAVNVVSAWLTRAVSQP